MPGLDYFVPILVDECVPYRVAVWLRDTGYEASHVTEVGRRGHPDHSQLEYAADKGMLLLTYNVADFLELDAEWRMTGKFHAGILLANDSTYQRYPRALVNDIRATLPLRRASPRGRGMASQPGMVGPAGGHLRLNRNG